MKIILDFVTPLCYNNNVADSIGVWSNGMTEVSKTFSEGSIPSTPVFLFEKLCDTEEYNLLYKNGLPHYATARSGFYDFIFVLFKVFLSIFQSIRAEASQTPYIRPLWGG